MKYLKTYENIDWEWNEEEENNSLEIGDIIRYIKDKNKVVYWDNGIKRWRTGILIYHDREIMDIISTEDIGGINNYNGKLLKLSYTNPEIYFKYDENEWEKI